MSNHEDPSTDPTTGPGTTNDPNQATRTGLPTKPDVAPELPDDGEPGTTNDPNQANRT